MHRILLLALAALSMASAVGAAPAPLQIALGPPEEAAGHAQAELYHRVVDGQVRVAIEVAIDEGWHLYHEQLGHPDAIGKPTAVELEGEGVRWSGLRWPEPHAYPDLLDEDVFALGHAGRIVLHAVGRLPEAGAAPAIAARISGVTCEEMGSCVEYEERLPSRGAGPDAFFADFPPDLAPPEPVQAKPVPEPVQEGHADARLFARVEGERVLVAIPIAIDEGWHLYHDELGDPAATGLPTTIELHGAGIEWGRPRFPEPERAEQPGLDSWIWQHGGEIVVHAAGRVLPGAQPGTVWAELAGLTCEDDGTCVLYSETVVAEGEGPDALFAAFPEDLLAATGEPSDPSAGATGREKPPARADAGYASVTFPDFRPRTDELSHGLGIWLLLAFVAGMILNVMPCVLPVISIKVLSFVRQAGEDRARILKLGLAFAAGILSVFIALASLAAFLGLGWGEQFQSQTFLVVMIGLVFAFALSMFGVYELGVPSAVGAAAGGQQREGLGQAFFNGMLATVLATPCSGPFLGSTLTWTVAQPWPIVYAIFLALGLGMALPYVVLTANPRLLKIVPKPGPWMETFKQAMGFVLLATVVYLMISLRQDLLLFAAGFLVFVALGCWWWGRFARFDQSSLKRAGVLATSFAIVALGARVAFVDFRGLFHEGAGGEIAWVEFEPDEFEELLEGGRSVFVDFTADWCPNCKYNERVVYEDEEILELFRAKRVARIKADITHDDERTQMIERLMRGLGANSIPFMAVFPADDPLRPHTRLDIVTKGDMREILASLPEPEAGGVRGGLLSRPD